MRKLTIDEQADVLYRHIVSETLLSEYRDVIDSEAYAPDDDVVLVFQAALKMSGLEFCASGHIQDEDGRCECTNEDGK